MRYVPTFSWKWQKRYVSTYLILDRYKGTSSVQENGSTGIQNHVLSRRLRVVVRGEGQLAGHGKS